MNFELDVDAKLALAQAGFKPVCSLGPGLIGQRWLFNNTQLGQVCGELVSATDARGRLLINNVAAFSGIEHPLIARVVRSGELGAGVFGTIFDIDPSEQRLISASYDISLPLFRRLLTQLATALCYLHKSGIAHGALSPYTVSLGRDFRLTDCWWAQDIRNHPLNEELEDGFCREVPDFAMTFAAPEICAGELRTRESDIFSFGALLYWVLTGFPPRTNGSGRQSAGVGYEGNARIRSLSQVRPDIDFEMAALIHLMLSEEPAQRPIAPWIAGMSGQLAGNQEFVKLGT
jgi:serine/threonine protein kinase